MDDMSAGLPKSKDEIQQKVSEYLRSIDKLIKAKQLDEALSQIEKARDIDSKNAYLTAFEYRIHNILHPPKEEEKIIVKKDVGVKEVEKKSEDKSLEIKEKYPVEDVWKMEDLKPVSINIANELKLKYEKRFTEEMKKVEQRAAEMQQNLEMKHSGDRTALLKNLEEEKQVYKDQIEQEYKSMLEQETQNLDSDYRKKLAAERETTEKQIRSQYESEYNAHVVDIQAALGAKTKGLLEEENKSLKAVEEKIEKEYNLHLKEEIARIKHALKNETEEKRHALEKDFREKLKKELSESLVKERNNISVEYEEHKTILEKNYIEQFRKINIEIDDRVKSRVKEVEKGMTEKFDAEKIKIIKQLQEKYSADFHEKLNTELEKAESRIQNALKVERQKLDQERQQIFAKEQDRVEELRNSIKVVIENEYQERLEDSAKDYKHSYEKVLKVIELTLPESKANRVKIYEGRLKAVWANSLLHSGGGTIEMNVADAQMLMEIKDLLGLSFEEHLICESGVRKQLYLEHVEGLISDGALDPSDEDTLKFLKQLFNFTLEEINEIEAEKVSQAENASVQSRILVVDDDESLLNIIESILVNKGYKVFAFDQLEKASAFIKLESVDLILSDVRFPEEEVDGYDFFKKVQQNPKMVKVPFILMSSLEDGLFMKTGVQLGIDDYLAKPLDMDLLLAVIEGKLKKYKMFR